MIREFQGENRWLSNFAPVKIVLDDLVYPSVEHAYMSAKSDEDTWKIFCTNPNNTAGQVKRKSRNICLIDGWGLKKLEVMRGCLEQKFNQEPYKTNLLNTGEEHIQEGNRWGDKFWGVCLKSDKGHNHLGKMIMSIREGLMMEQFYNFYDERFYF